MQIIFLSSSYRYNKTMNQSISSTIPIQKYMTASVHTIGGSQPLKVAENLMREFRIRHLPVLEAGKLVGILSDRDIKLAARFIPNSHQLKVGEVMCENPYVVDSKTSLTQVLNTMSELRMGSALVVEQDKLCGIFTAVDGLRAFAKVLAARAISP